MDNQRVPSPRFRLELIIGLISTVGAVATPRPARASEQALKEIIQRAGAPARAWTAVEHKLRAIERDRTLGRALKVTGGSILLGKRPGHEAEHLFHTSRGLVLRVHEYKRAASGHLVVAKHYPARLGKWGFGSKQISPERWGHLTPEGLSRSVEAWTDAMRESQEGKSATAK